jgi:hypothetical protein
MSSIFKSEEQMLLYFLINDSLKKSGTIFSIDDFTNVTFACDMANSKLQKEMGNALRSVLRFLDKGILKALS